MAKKTEISSDDQKIFREAMRGVKRLSHNKILPPKTPVIHKIKPKLNVEDEETIHFSDFAKLELVYSEDKLEFSRSGIQHKILRNLRGGQYNVEAVLDLHGKTVEEARQSLGRFLLKCKQNKIRHALLIHGKGRSHSKPILKNKLNNWLRQIDDVLAFCSATPKDGGNGALYVLLRR